MILFSTSFQNHCLHCTPLVYCSPSVVFTSTSPCLNVPPVTGLVFVKLPWATRSPALPLPVTYLFLSLVPSVYPCAISQGCHSIRSAYSPSYRTLLSHADTLLVSIPSHSLLALCFGVNRKCSPSLSTLPLAQQCSPTPLHFLLNSIPIISLRTPNINTTS